MPQVCLYFQLHQPYRLEPFSVFDLDQDHDYFETKSNHNQDIFCKVSQKSYRPMLSLLLQLCRMYDDFSCALSMSGVFFEQAESYDQKVIQLLKSLAETGQVEFLAETYYHSLAALYSEREFMKQVDLHQKLIQHQFGQTPTTFRNTELIYCNYVAYLVSLMGFQGMLTEAVDRHLHGRPRTQIYRSQTDKPLPLLLKHAPLSDDIAFRFSDKNWSHHPLHADTYVGWLHDYYQEDSINLFMDFETFGEHQWADTGVFDFFAEMVRQLILSPYAQFKTPNQLLKKFNLSKKVSSNAQTAQQSTQSLSIELIKSTEKKSSFNLQRIMRSCFVNDFSEPIMSLPIYDVPEPISWADVDRDLTAWRDNDLQWDTLRLIYSLENEVLKTRDEHLVSTWRKLQTSDHFYYMCTKWAADGDVHAYFSPYDSPWEAYNRYAAVVADFKGRLFDFKLREKKL